MYLKGLGSNQHGGFSGIDLGHGRLFNKRQALILKIGGPVGQQPRGVNSGGHIGQEPLNCLEVGNRPAKLPALPGVSQSPVKRPLGNTHPLGGNISPAGIYRLQSDLKTLPLFTQTIGLGHKTVLKD